MIIRTEVIVWPLTEYKNITRKIDQVVNNCQAYLLAGSKTILSGHV